MYFSIGSLTQYRKYCESKSKGEPCCEFAIKSQTVATQGIYKILKIINFLHFRLPCAVCTLEAGLASTRDYTMMFTLCAVFDI